MAEHEANAGVRVPPPIIYLGGFLVGWLMQAMTPLPGLDEPLDLVIGITLLLLGFALVVPSALLFIRAGTNLPPHQPTTALVFSGPYRFTRNPIYLGFTLIYAGAALWSSITWALLVLVFVVIVVDRAVIAREERYLTKRFGEEYLGYKARVRRWL
ncbi:MAG TPA: isoprenylcysteine carboxylmethyltransferase family protein [Actinomycetota bacterium]|nr:isoprenylcysteine carboxylmethyltransferase family protein [Actinomycetota bacterium]